MLELNESQVGFIGGGNMARSLVGGLIGRGVAPMNLRVAEPVLGLRESLAHDFGIAATDDNVGVAAASDVLLLAVKPQVMKVVCQALAPTVQARRPTIISIAAGIRIEQLERWLGGSVPIIRAMPNTPALIGEGVTGLCANAAAGDAELALAESLLSSAGATVRIDAESLMDAVTAVSGSGPAYFFLLIEAMEAAGVAQGLSPEQARALVLATAVGAARMARESSEPASELRRRVTSPGGTTQAAIEAFEAGGFRELVDRAIARATERGRELADGFKD